MIKMGLLDKYKKKKLKAEYKAYQKLRKKQVETKAAAIRAERKAAIIKDIQMNKAKLNAERSVANAKRREQLKKVGKGLAKGFKSFEGIAAKTQTPTIKRRTVTKTVYVKTRPKRRKTVKKRTVKRYTPTKRRRTTKKVSKKKQYNSFFEI